VPCQTTPPLVGQCAIFQYLSIHPRTTETEKSPPEKPQLFSGPAKYNGFQCTPTIFSLGFSKIFLFYPSFLSSNSSCNLLIYLILFTLCNNIEVSIIAFDVNFKNYRVSHKGTLEQGERHMTSQTDHQVKLLIVDDNPDDRFLYKRLLQKVNGINWSILESENGEDGLDLCKKENPDCILLDYILPDIDGLEFLLQLKNMSLSVPVIMLTGQGDETVAVLAMKEGAKDYLSKDVLTPASLKGTILNCIEAFGKPSNPDWGKKEKVDLISEIETLEKKLASSSGIDALTGLPNRSSMLEKLHYEKCRFERNKKPFSMVMADIDDLNILRESHGPQAENEILTQVAKWLDFNTRKQDVVCHWGKKRFVLLLPETDFEGARLFIEKLCKKVEQETFTLNGREIGLTMSFSVGVYNDANLKIEDCIQQADECLI